MDKYKSLEELYIDNYKLIYTFFFDHTNHKQIAEDLASVLWSKVAEDPKKFLEMDKRWLQNYLRKVAKNLTIDFFKSEKKYRESVDISKEIIELVPSPEEEYLLKEEFAYLEQAKSVLTESELELVCLRYIAGLSPGDIAADLGLTAGAVRIKQHRILKKLKREITHLMNQSVKGGNTWEDTRKNTAKMKS